METIKQVNRVKEVFLILISILLLSCTDNKREKLLEIIIDDFKSINSSKNISVDIRQDSVKSKYYFIIVASDKGFERPHYTCNYRSYEIDMLNNTKDFDLKILNKINLEYVQPKAVKYNVEKTDNSILQTTYIYEINDSIVEKGMTFDIYGDMINERIISKKWR